MARAGYILAPYQTGRSNPRGFRGHLCYLYQCNTSEEHSELGEGICITWAQTQPRAVAKWEAEPHRRQSTTDRHNGSCLCLSYQDYLALWHALACLQAMRVRNWLL